MLLAYNLTGSPVTLAGTSVVLPASASPPNPGIAINITAEISGFNAGQFAALEAQRPLTVLYVWTAASEYPTFTLTTKVIATVSVTAGDGLINSGTPDNTIFDVVANADGSIVVNPDDVQVGVLATDAQHGLRGGGSQHAVVVPAGAAGFMSGSDKTKLDGLPTSAVPTTRNLTAGVGLSGGGTLAADRTFDLEDTAVTPGSYAAADITVDAQGRITAAANAAAIVTSVTAGTGLTGGGAGSVTVNAVANADGSIIANANDLQVGILATDAQHGSRGGGTQHSNVVAAGASGFMTGSDKTKLDGIATGATATPLATVAPVDVTKSAAVIGASTEAAKADHKHNIATTTAGAIAIGDAAAEGSSTSLARADHVHSLAAPAAPVNVTKAAASAGAATTVARSDHKHDVTTAAAGALAVGDAPAEGSASTLSRSDHVHSFPAPGAPVAVDGTAASAGASTNVARQDHKHSLPPAVAPADVTKAAAAAGTSTNIARSDHKHDVSTAIAGTIYSGDAAAEGSATSLSRSDHIHAVPVPTAPINVTKAAAAIGSSSLLAKADHKHDITTAAAGTIAIGDVAGEGSATTIARSDHTHALPIPAPPANVTKAAASAGVSATVARADHKHDITTAAAGAILIDDVAAEGSSTSLARADHTHALPGPSDPYDVDVSPAFAGIGTAVARWDHKHDVSVATPVDVGTANAEGTAADLARADHVHNTPFSAVNNALGAATASISVNTQKITNLGAPTAATDAATKSYVDTFVGVVPTSRTLTAGAGLTGGGDLSANRTFDVVGNADGSIVANANDVQVGILASDAQHGVRGGGTQHAVVIAAGAAGFMSGADKTKIDGLPTTAPPTSRTLTAGAGLTGGGDLSANRTFDVIANADGSITVNANDIQVGILATDAQHGNRAGGSQHADVIASGASGFMTGSDKTKLDGISAGAASLTSSAPANVTKAAATVGVATDAARADHKHDITTATPVATATANAEGTATSLARSDHTHQAKIDCTEVSATGAVTTTSTTDVVLTTMTITPGAGNWFVLFNCWTSQSTNNNTNTFSIYVNGSQVARSVRTWTENNNLQTGVISIIVLVTGVTAGQAIDVRWRVNANTGTVTERTLNVIRAI